MAFEKVIQIQPKNIEARIGLAKAYIGLGKNDDAEKVLKDAISIDPKNPQPYLELAKLYLEQNKTNEALITVETGYKQTLEVNLLKLLKEYAEKYIQEGKYESDIAILEKTLGINPNYTDARLDLAKAYTALGRYGQAEKVLKDGIKVKANEPELYLELANLYLKQGKLDDAITLLQEGYEATNAKIKELLDELLQEKQNNGIISEKTGERLVSDYLNAKTYHLKGTKEQHLLHLKAWPRVYQNVWG